MIRSFNWSLLFVMLSIRLVYSIWCFEFLMMGRLNSLVLGKLMYRGLIYFDYLEYLPFYVFLMFSTDLSSSNFYIISNLFSSSVKANYYLINPLAFTIAFLSGSNPFDMLCNLCLDSLLFLMILSRNDT